MLTCVRVDDRWASFDAPTLTVACLVANTCGFQDVDVEPMEPGRVRITAKSDKRTITYTGTTVHDACHKLIVALAGV